jgi:hypothetical protein
MTCLESAISDGWMLISPSLILPSSWRFSMTISGYRCLDVESFTLASSNVVVDPTRSAGLQVSAYRDSL